MGEGATLESGRLAFKIFYFHWGAHAWGTYVIVGLAMALSQFRKGRPALISSCLTPLFGERFASGKGRAIDVLAIWATIMGVVTSLGLGAMQVVSGLNASLGTPQGATMQVVVICVITLLFIFSAVTGIKRGIKILSLLNVALMVFVLCYFASFGPTAFIADIFASTLGRYLTELPVLSFTTELFGNKSWTQGWTVFYWAWWIAWAPFVGAFIARISRGRTVREFIGVVLVLPALFSFLFSSALGGTAVYLDLYQGGGIGELVASNLEGALFETLRYLPAFGVLATVANILIISFFVTSADSATYVISSFSTHGSGASSKRLVVFWGCALGGMAAVLLTAGGLKALQTASIVGSFPFIAIMWLLLAATVKELIQEHRQSAQTSAAPSGVAASDNAEGKA
jgi:glycine betaine transporter